MRIRITPAAVVGTTALVLALSGTAVAASGGTFRLGHINKTTSNTVINNSKGTALVLAAKKGIAPFGVNGNKVKVPSLNSDFLDGLDSTALQRRVTGQCGATGITAISATGSVTCATAHHLYFTSGTASFTVPAGVTQVEVMARGGGGSGGNSGTTVNLGRGGGGGQGGVSTTLVAVTAGQLYTVSVGAGGVAPTASAADGTVGGKSTVILNPSADATKFVAVANGGGAGAGAVLCSATAGANNGDGGTAPGPTGAGALGLTGQTGAAGTPAGVTTSTTVCASGGIGGGAGYAGAGGDGGTPSTTAPVAAKAGAAGLVEVTLID
ncbi:MAG: trimeric autotransporter adhesin [Frankiales bacterium]|nr:trimeric autotransporter adhesin [Frankiales bacterium]